MKSALMAGLKLSTLSVLLGLGLGLPHIYGVLKPAAFGQWLRRFPRNTPLGYPLILIATGWFLYYVQQENVADFANLKPVLYGLFTLVGVGSCFFLQDYLPVRGLAVLLLLGAKLIVDTAHLVETEWRLVLVTWAYIWVLVGMWFTVSPWKARDLIQWATATEARIRWMSAVRLAFAILLLVLGLTVFRAEERSTFSFLTVSPLLFSI